MINYNIKGFYKTTCYKTKSNFSVCVCVCVCFFVFFVFLRKFENADRNILPKTYSSNVILAFSDHMKPKILCQSTMVADIERHPFSKSLDPLLLSKHGS